MTIGIRARAVTCATCLMAALAACGQPSSPPTWPIGGGPASLDGAPLVALTTTGAWPPCAPEIPRVLAMPVRFAPNFPFPPNLKVFKVTTLHNNPNEVQIVGYAPLALDDALQRLASGLRQAGYGVSNVDVEPGESEAEFSGNGWTGAYWVRDVGNCPGVTEWVVMALKR